MNKGCTYHELGPLRAAIAAIPSPGKDAARKI